jgi:hypothetical protein
MPGIPRGKGRAEDNNVLTLALIRVLLSGNPPFQGLHCLHPLTSPWPHTPILCQPMISRLYGNEKLLFFTKKIGGDKVINTYFVQESI